jgi:hypothetical protein
MPVVSTNSPKNAVTPIFAIAALGVVYQFAADDTFASIQPADTDHAAQPGQPLPRTPTVALPAGSTVVLPGPTTDATKLPSNGDYYSVADPVGRLGVGGGEVTIDGGGYPINGAATQVLTVAYSEATFTFDDAAQAWIYCLCKPGED